MPIEIGEAWHEAVLVPNFISWIAALLLFVGLASITACSSAEQRAQNYYDHGEQLLAAGDLDKAALEFRNALKLKDDMVPAMFALGQIAEQKGDFQSAMANYRNVAERDTQPRRRRV